MTKKKVVEVKEPVLAPIIKTVKRPRVTKEEAILVAKIIPEPKVKHDTKELTPTEKLNKYLNGRGIRTE